MFCGKCGNELAESEMFCGKCGEPVRQPVKKVQVQNMGNWQNKAEQIPNTNRQQQACNGGAAGNNPVKGMYLIGMACNILLMILWFCPVYKCSVIGQSISFALNDQCEGSEMLPVLMVGIALVSAILLVIPVIKNDTLKHRYLIFPKLTSIWCAVLFMMAFITNINEADPFSGVGASVGLTGAGVLYLLTSVGLTVLLFVISARTKKAGAQK